MQYTPEPWHVAEQRFNGNWLIVAKSPQSGTSPVAIVPDAAKVEENRANAYLIAQAPAMHRAAVKLMCAWGTEDAQEAMEELAVILSKAKDA